MLKPFKIEVTNVDAMNSILNVPLRNVLIKLLQTVNNSFIGSITSYDQSIFNHWMKIYYFIKLNIC